MADFAVFDSEDDSPELEAKGLPGFQVKTTLLAGIAPDGKRFLLRPRVKRTIRSGRFKRYEMDTLPFLNWLESLGHVKVYAHNSRYDLGRIGVPLDGPDLSLVGTRLISARLGKVTFLDSLNLWPMALKKVGDVVGLKKLDMDVRSDDYVFRDCEIVRRAVSLAQRIAAEYETELPATLGSLCVRLWKSLGGHNWFCADQYFREAYFGGRTELFHHGGTGDIVYTDINSLYPHVMTFPFPSKALPWFGYDDPADARTHLCELRRNLWGVASVTLDIPECVIAPLPVEREDGSITYPFGRVRGVYTVHEIRNALAHGARLVALDYAVGSLTAFPFYRKFVRLFYQRRKMSTDEGMREFFKLLMNNYYGQLGMSGTVTRSLKLDQWLVRDGTGNPVLGESGEPLLKRDGIPYGRKLLADVQMPLPEHVNYLHAAYVTSYARLELQRYLRRVPPERLIYCDTDSVFCFSPGFRLPYPVGPELGEMKLVAQCSFVDVRAPKLYKVRYQTKSGKERTYYKAKGVPSRMVSADKQQVAQGKLKPELARTYSEVFFETGHAEFRQPWQLRESIRFLDAQRGKPLSHETRILSTWHDTSKTLNAKYDKKRFDGERFFPIKNLPTDEK